MNRGTVRSSLIATLIARPSVPGLLGISLPLSLSSSSLFSLSYADNVSSIPLYVLNLALIYFEISPSS